MALKITIQRYFPKISSHGPPNIEHDTPVQLIKKRNLKSTAAKRSKDDDQHQEPLDLNRMKNEFTRLAGDKQEIAWAELRSLLSFGLRNDISNGLAQTHIQSSEAGPSVPQTEIENPIENIIQLVVGMLCMSVCKDQQAVNEFASKAEETPLIYTNQLSDVKSYTGFTSEVCRSMMAMYDDDCSGKMGFHEFQELWKDISHWIVVFKKYDHDKSLTISGFELREALHDLGYLVNAHTLNLIMIRYGSDGELSFESFMISLVRLAHLIAAFETKDTSHSGIATFSMEEWLNATMYC